MHDCGYRLCHLGRASFLLRILNSFPFDVIVPYILALPQNEHWPCDETQGRFLPVLF